MKIYFVVIWNRYPIKIGSVNKHKMEMMYTGEVIHTCDISYFDGEQLSSEYFD